MKAATLAIAGAALAAGLGLGPPFLIEHPTAQAAQPAAQISPADAAPYLGDWILELQGPNGPGTFDLNVKVDKEKVVGQIATPTLETQAITDITKSGDNLVLRYTFNYEGSPVDAAVYLMPAPEAKDGKRKAQIDFAGGAYVMTGTAAKKEQAK